MTNLERLEEALRRIEKLEAAVFPPLDLRNTDEEQRVNDPRFPSRKEVEVYFKQCGRNDPEADWEGFFLQYDAQGWRAGNGVEVGNWKSLAGKWLRKNTKSDAPVTPLENAIPRAYVPPVNAIVEERKREIEQAPPDEVTLAEIQKIKAKLRGMGVQVGDGQRPNVRVNSDLERVLPE